MTKANETTATEATQVEQLQAQAADKRARAATLLEQADTLDHTAANLSQVFETEAGTPVQAKRRDGSVVDATFVAAKDTGRGILVAVTVGEGFDIENLRLPLSNVFFEGPPEEPNITNPLAGVAEE